MKELLKNNKLFKYVEDNILEEITKNADILNFEKGQIIIWKGDQTTDLYIILKGKVNVITFDEKGNELIITTLSKGDFVGELSLIDGKPRSMSVETLTDTQVAVIRRNFFLKAIEKYPQLCLQLAKNLVERIRKTDEILESLAFLDVKRRIVKYIKDNGIFENNKIYKINKISHSELAKRIGSSREAVSKAIKSLSEKGIIEEKDNCFILKANSIYEE